MDDRTFASVPQVQRHLTYRTLVSEFTDDPVERWLYPELPDYLTHSHGCWWRSEDGPSTSRLSGVSASAPPSRSGCAPAPNQTAMPLSPCSPRGSHQTSTMTRSLLPILRFPTGISRGLTSTPPWGPRGRELMEHCLEIVDANLVPAHLETRNPRNLTFYERHGFEVTDTAQVGRCPPITFMLRAAR